MARALGARGAAVGLVARSDEALQATAAEVERLGGRGLAAPADVAEGEQVQTVARAVEETLGPVDLWVNAAMATVFAPVVDVTPAEYRRATEVTYLGVVHGTLAALELMRPRDRGVIVQVGSALAYRALPLQSAYCGAKHAIRGFTDSLRCELLAERSGIRLTAVHLPALDTPQFDAVRTRLPRRPRPVAPVYAPEVAARAVVWAAEHERRELWVGHTTAGAIVAGFLAPGRLDRYLARTGFDAQQTPEPQPPRDDDLFAPLPGDPGAHGRFGGEARTRSFQLWATTHRRALLAVGATAATARFLAARRW